jgi:hypothetical protein
MSFCAILQYLRVSYSVFDPERKGPLLPFYARVEHVGTDFNYVDALYTLQDGLINKPLACSVQSGRAPSFPSMLGTNTLEVFLFSNTCQI